jgi:hypothetical protein
MRTIGLGLGLLGLLVVLGIAWAADEDQPKYTIKDVMKAAHSGGANSLLRKAAGQNGTKQDREKLLELYEALAKNKPPQGEEKSWKDKTGTLVAQAKAVAGNERGAAQKLVMAANCKACHDAHRAK